MERKEVPAFFTIGDWTVRPLLRTIDRPGECRVLEPKVMDVLVYLAHSDGAVIDKEQLLTDCWRGTFYGDNPVHKTIALIRKALGDDARSPRYIATIRKRGYRMLVPTRHAPSVNAASAPPSDPTSRIYRIALRCAMRDGGNARTQRLRAASLIAHSACHALLHTFRG